MCLGCIRRCFSTVNLSRRGRVQYGGSNHTLSLRNVLVQRLAPGKFSYDLNKRVVSIGAKPQPPKAKVTRDFKALTLPKAPGR